MKISIVTVTFNSEKTLQDTLDSVLRQDYRNIEHIIIDGGSTDSTVDIIRAYASKTTSHSVKWVSEKDRGIYDAMNKGIAMATGEVIGILNSDDYFTSDDIVSKLARPFEDETLEAVYGDIHFIHDVHLIRLRAITHLKFSPLSGFVLVLCQPIPHCMYGVRSIKR